MTNPRLAGRYAKSLIDLSIEKNQLEIIYNDIKFLQSLCKQNPDFVNMLKSPANIASEYAFSARNEQRNPKHTKAQPKRRNARNTQAALV